MWRVKKLLEDLKRLRGAESSKIAGMSSADVVETLANAILDLEAEIRIMKAAGK